MMGDKVTTEEHREPKSGERRPIARRHHWISKLYLKAFAVPRKHKMQTTVFDRQGRQPFTTPIDNVAVERDFNRVELAGEAPDAFETALADIESDLSPAIERIGTAGVIRDADDRACLLNLIGLFHLRTPRRRQTTRDFHERVAKQIMDLLVSTPERWASQVARAKKDGFMSPDADTDYEKMKAFVREGAFKIETPTEQHIVLEMSAFDAILPHLFGRGWMLVEAPKSSGGFVTSDHPVCLMWSAPPTGPGIRPIGLGLRGTEIVFPVSPRIAAIGAFELDDGVHRADEAMVASINGTIIAFAERQVYARDLNFHYTLQDAEPARKASKLITDANFLRAQREPSE
jgi:Protein of unknown function (DUF4238)